MLRKNSWLLHPLAKQAKIQFMSLFRECDVRPTWQPLAQCLTPMVHFCWICIVIALNNRFDERRLEYDYYGCDFFLWCVDFVLNTGFNWWAIRGFVLLLQILPRHEWRFKLFGQLLYVVFDSTSNFYCTAFFRQFSLTVWRYFWPWKMNTPAKRSPELPGITA